MDSKMDSDMEETAGIEVTDEELAAAVEELNGSSRIKRQKASHLLMQLSDSEVERLLPYADDIADGLLHEEPQTRWEVLHALTRMGRAGQTYGDDVLAAAEDALYDETSGTVREAAFQFICGYGAASPGNSDKVWPLIDEALHCYHGDPEYSKMLTHLVAFAQGDVSMEALEAVAQRMKFDSRTAHGTLRMRSEQVVEAYFARGGEFEEEPEEGSEEEE